MLLMISTPYFMNENITKYKLYISQDCLLLFFLGVQIGLYFNIKSIRTNIPSMESWPKNNSQMATTLLFG